MQLSKEELQKVIELQTKTQQHTFEYGQYELQKVSLKERVKLIDIEQSNIYKDLQTLAQQEQDLAKEFNEKYGVGTINLETGEITPMAETRKLIPTDLEIEEIAPVS